ncbi:TonB-dependent vitamin B12 receptor [Oleiagrimonas sp. C23AA]|uniref:TonB-dependent vitamin B12 receptor n=1 Tax=Oleiagrimonas sp. C23AA TaxID=2719047 RepID=UPI00141F331B|nr:TonB-dependent vitamin B12 receptor [Oleiagrimonas sp. C23AA]NII11249.1 TonB-dependent vitamin B12 receptor [Oleiagrimonas sp. C23AA]
MRLNLLASAVLLAVAAPAFAAPQSDHSISIDPVVVTATRTAEPVSHTLAPVTVITRADIDRLQPESLQDLLTGLPGVAFSNAGGMGQQTSLFLRGTNSTHTLVLIDGVRIGSVSAGLAAFEQIPVDQIQRIEIVRGPRASLYGADAIGGVIQIFTRHGKAGQAPTPSLSVTGGSHNTWRGEAGLSGGSDHAWYNVSLGSQYTHGINSCKVGAGDVFAGCFVNEPDKDGYRNYNGLFSGGYRWDNGTELAVTGMRSKSFVEYDGSPYGGNMADNEQRVAGARLSLTPVDGWDVSLNAGQSKDLSTTYYQGTYYGVFYPKAPTGYANSRRDDASWQNAFTLAANQQLTAGVDYSREHLDSSTAYINDSRDNTGVFAQYQGRFGANELQLSLRHDHNQPFGNHGTGAIAWGYDFTDGLRLTASYASAFHAPTFNDLYYPSTPGYAPSADPNLKPESAHNVELGLGGWYTRWSWQVSAYQNTIDDLIALDANYTPGNISRARIRGVEGQFKGQWAGWLVHTYLTWQQPKNIDGSANDGNLLPRRFERSARVDLDRHFGVYGLGATLYAASGRYDDAANTHHLGGYGTLDLRASYRFLPHWDIQARVANVFDHSYETSWYYNQPGRTAYVTLRYRPH